MGRDAEIEHLRRVLGQAKAGRGQVVAIVGDAGVGKSRLVHEFTHSHRVQEWLLLEASSVSCGKSTSYLAVIDLLKGYFKIGDGDDHREMRDKVLGRVLGLDRALEPILAPLLALLDVPVEDPAWQNLDPPQRRQRTLDAVKRLLLPPCSNSAARSSAVIGENGMPSARSGTMAALEAALFADSGPATPLIAPRPNSSGRFAIRRSSP